MRTAGFSKEQLRLIDDEMRKFIKVTLNLVGPASVASNEYVYGASDAGCHGIPCLEDEHDVVCVDSAFKLLTSADDHVRRLAWSDLADQIQFRAASNNDAPAATAALVEAFLSGSCDPPLHQQRSNSATVWSTARNASRRLGATWRCPEWGIVSVTYADKTLSAADRRNVQRSFKAIIRTDRAQRLQQYPSQGVAMECVSGSKWGNQFLRTGDNIRFCDWRFVHKARLNLCNLNGQRFSSHGEPVDRSCSHTHESLQHVLSNCTPTHHLRTKRHDAVVARIVNARRRGWRILGRNQDVDGSGLRPDIVLYQGNTALLIDVAVPYENRLEAFSRTSDLKAAKYAPVVDHLKRTFSTVHSEAIVVGSLGSWDRTNDRVLRIFCNKRYANKMRRLACTDVLSHSCDIFHQHVRGLLPDQPRFVYGAEPTAPAPTTTGVTTPCLPTLADPANAIVNASESAVSLTNTVAPASTDITYCPMEHLATHLRELSNQNTDLNL